jgi:hypothetical protein
MHQPHGKFARTSMDTNVLQAVHILQNASRNPVDKPDKAMTLASQITASHNRTAPSSSRNSIDRRIRAFLNGESHGEDVLGALYGHVADEPVPQRLRALLKD